MSDLFHPTDDFPRRHIGPRPRDVEAMLAVVGCDSLEALMDEAVTEKIRRRALLDLPPARGEAEVSAALKALAEQNEVRRSLIGMGYHDCHVPAVIARNILENPGWYTQYTPYQPEISQGRLEALVNFQTMVADLTGLPLANSSLLDEATAAAEAVTLCVSAGRGKRQRFFVAADCHPQTIDVVRTRAEPLDITVEVGEPASLRVGPDLAGVLLQYPGTDGRLADPTATIEAVHGAGALVVMATDLLALCVLRAPGEWGADVAIGSSQRFGVPLGFGGPHAAFMATHDKLARQMPGRIVGVSKDARDGVAYRLALQTREQHIRRDKATSNICTAQVLLAIMAGMYGVYHGPRGLRRIAERVHGLTRVLARGLARLGIDVPGPYFDTLAPRVSDPDAVHAAAGAAGFNLRRHPDGRVGVALDERTEMAEIDALLRVFAGGDPGFRAADVATEHGEEGPLPAPFRRETEYLTHEVFAAYHAEHEMLRYLNRLQAKDLSLTTSMIPLGSCTMKLNATSEMLPVSFPGFGALHPFVPAEQARGYQALFHDLERWLAECTGFAAVSLQPNAGSQGEYAGLLAIRGWHQARGEGHRDVCLIPTSAHGTNPASAVMAGMRVVAVACNERGDIDLADLRAKAAQHASALGALMITYPSTHGVFEEGVVEVCEVVHAHGGQVYMDGANMNAQLGLCRPGDIGADVCHLNLHKTFCIPHGGGGPGMGPICVAAHLAPYLPSHPVTGHEGAVGPIAAAPYGSPSILPISYAYIAMMGGEGLAHATRVAILNANYLASRLKDHYDVLYTGPGGRCAHEFILDCRPFKAAGVQVDDIAKRLMDYGFHAPTMSFPVAGTLMVEPTESESKAELDRFCDAMIAIREEIRAIERGELDAEDNPLKNAPHTAEAVTADDWVHPYSRQQAAWPAPWTKVHKYWPPVARVDNVYGDRHLFCSCPPWEG